VQKFNNKILIYGAGQAGKKVLQILKLMNVGVTGFLDQNIKKNIKNYPVFKEKDLDNLIKNKKINTIIFAIPSINFKKKLKIFERIKKKNINILEVNENVILKNHIGINDISEVNPEYILGKKPIKSQININKFKNKTILITGACGSIGRGLVNKLLLYNLKEIILIDRSEFGFYNLNQKIDLMKKKYKIKAKFSYYLGDLTNEFFLKNSLKNKNINYIFHCAAYKHVDIVEDNLLEGFYNNIKSTYNLLNHIKYNRSFESFVLISTDKAHKPINLMGMTKRLSEKLVIAKNYGKNDKKFRVVRFGNVFASDGSAIPKMCSQIINNEAVSVTDKRMTRYFLTMNEACELVLSASILKKNVPDILFFKMGKVYKIVEIVKKISKFFNKKIKLKIIGTRKGEKLHEILFSNKKIIKTEDKSIFGINEKNKSEFNSIEFDLNILFKLYFQNNAKKLIFFLRSLCN
jgi:FlaA1/EpsC-like NDP-sugar epimerase